MERVVRIAALVLLAALLLPGISLVLHRKPGWLRAVKWMILGVYLLANVQHTLLFRAVQPDRPVEWGLLWSYRQALTFPDGLMSLVKGTVQVERRVLLYSILLNILLYVPMGYLLPYVLKRLKGWQTLLIALGASALTEIAQLVFRIGWFELDDVLNNMLGAVLGLMLYAAFVRPMVRRAEKTEMV
ncbi:MAG: VanZ family protein [Clostridia bacterium]|nr:VanZ family protein [Clostridia bacterium]